MTKPLRVSLGVATTWTACLIELPTSLTGPRYDASAEGEGIGLSCNHDSRLPPPRTTSEGPFWGQAFSMAANFAAPTFEEATCS